MAGYRGGDKLLPELLLTQIIRCMMTNGITNTRWVKNLHSWHTQHKTSWLVNHKLKKGNPLVLKDNFSDPAKHQPSLFISHDVNQHTLSNPSLGHVSLMVFQISWKWYFSFFLFDPAHPITTKFCTSFMQNTKWSLPYNLWERRIICPRNSNYESTFMCNGTLDHNGLAI